MSKDFEFDKNVVIENIGDLCTQYMKIFGANNNLMRHLPSLIDGLKPVERRALYDMYIHGHTHKSNFTKVAKIVGSVMATWHPHGDIPIFETMTKMAQPWANLKPLIDGQGNFGSPAGDSAAAARYIEARLSFYAYKCFFEDFSLNLVDTKKNYLEDDLEPEYLPARYPNVLVNSTFGIGYGLSTGLPTYNFTEAMELTIKLLEDPNYENITLIPDSPTWAEIVDEGQFETISRTGKGKFKMRGEILVDDKNHALIIRSVPLQVNANAVKQSILKLADEGKIQGIKHIKVHTGEEAKNSPSGFEIHIFIKKEIDPYAIKHVIYTKTQMEKPFPVNFKLIDDYQDYDYNVRDLILAWLDYRRDIKRRQYNIKLIESKERLHILETILMIFTGDNAEKSLRAIRQAENRKEIVEYLMKTFKSISSLQAQNIADMKMSAFSKESIEKYKKEKKEIESRIAEYDKIIRSSKKIDKIIKEELEEGIRLFGEPRRSKIVSIAGELKVRNTRHVVVFTVNGFVKKLPHDTTSIGHVNQGDYPIEIVQVNNLTDLMIFDESGNISKLPVQSLLNTELSSEGEKLSKYCKVKGKIASIIPKPTMDDLEKIKAPVYFIMVTKNGIVKKTSAINYVNMKNELLALIVKDGDELKSVRLMVGDKDILVYTNRGFGVRFSSTEVRETDRMSIGVKALDMSEPEEQVIGMDVINESDNYLFCLTNKGTGKKCTLDTFKTMARASKPLRILSLDDDEEVILIRTVKGSEKFKAYLKNSVEEIDIESVPELTRLSKGRKLIPVRKGEIIIDIKEVK